MDPTNPLSGYTETTSPVPESQISQTPTPPKDSHWISILSMAIFVLLSLGAVAFLYYQNQQLKGMLASYQTPVATSTPSATPDPTANWKIYTNQEYLYEFKCPPTSIYKKTSLNTPNGIAFPYFQESCVELNDQINISVWKTIDQSAFTLESKTKELLSSSLKPFDYKESTLGTYKMITYQEQNVTSAIERSAAIIILKDKFIKMEGFSKEYFDQILSTFKFTEATSSASPTPAQKACTQEAKLCPDGSYVGRTGPNCEFTACPQ